MKQIKDRSVQMKLLRPSAHPVIVDLATNTVEEEEGGPGS
jgi:hypothetical protein